MKKKPNITLKNLADTKDIGLFLSLKKALNEVMNKSFSYSLPKAKNIKNYSHYTDLISVIICTMGNTSNVTRAVKSILNQDFPKDKYEIIIVNNSNTPFERSFFQENIRITEEPVLGLSKARNTGSKEARGEYLLYIDDDAVANEGLLKHIYSAYNDHKGVSLIGGQIFLNLPKPTPNVFLESKESLWSGYTVPYKHFKTVKEHYEFPYGACFSIRHSALDILGGFSESYGRRGRDFAGGEETALCFKALRYGFKIGIEPKASVLHMVEEHRFTEEHIKKTIRMGILTTYRLCKEGYAPYMWTKAYINERIRILDKEISKLKAKDNNLALFYKECELSAFEELRIINN